MWSVVLVAGARPNFVKIAPIQRALRERAGRDAVALIHTGQHYDAAMSGIFFEELGIPVPDAHLGVGSGSHAHQTAQIMDGFERYLLGRPRPTGVVVVGDVNSTLATALVAAKLAIPVAHVEAGLRCGDRTMPEEINRIVVDAVSDLLLVSEPAGEENLRREGVAADRIRYVGNVMIDSLCRELVAAKELDIPRRRGLTGEYAVVTLHRTANVDDDSRLHALGAVIAHVAARMPVIFPVHPRTAQRLRETSADWSSPQLSMCEPLGYREFLGLIASARLVLTDSGGIQEETSYLGVPCVTLRPTTERPVTLTAGTNSLAEPATARDVIDSVLAKPRSAPATIPGWDGAAAPRIAGALLERWR